jgi:hypothetical protein
MKLGTRLQDMAAEVERQALSKSDFVAPVAQMTMNSAGRLTLAQNGTMALRTLAHDQLGEYLEIPKTYYQRMLSEDTSLLAANVNRWLTAETEGKKKEGRLIRTLDNEVRAVLSPSYQSEGMDNLDFLRVLFPIVKSRGLITWSAAITETRMYWKVVDQSITLDVPTGRKLGDGSHVFFDTISPALLFSNSEVGLGSYSIAWGKFTKVCTNLAAHEQLMRKVHIGRRAEVTDDVYQMLSNETKQKMAETLTLQARDIVESALSKARLEAHAEKLGVAVAQKIPGKDAERILDVTAKRFGWTQEERDGIFGELIEAGDFSRYGAHNAVTLYSSKVASYDRASELERDGGRIIDLEPAAWQTLTESREVVKLAQAA